jgi:IclR family transcriptional regulator, pca regulon regulatory protein
MKMPDAPSSDFVQSLGRGLQVLATVAEQGGVQTLSSVAQATGLTRGTARRLLATLCELGLLDHHGREYRLTSQVLELGYGYLSSLGLPALVGEPIRALSADIGEAVSVTIREDLDIVYISRANPSRVMTVSLGVGARLPVWNTSMGRVLLSALDDTSVRSLLERAAPMAQYTSLTATDVDELLSRVEAVREQGWCLVDQELEWGLRSLAVPLRQRGVVVAALNAATAQVGENPGNTVARLLPSLQRAQEKIEWALDRAPGVGVTPGASRPE